MIAINNNTTVHKVTILGMPLHRWIYKSCCCDIAIGDGWATVYTIQSNDQGKGHATHLLLNAKIFYESIGKRFGGSVALNERMSSLYKRLGIKEYDEMP